MALVRLFVSECCFQSLRHRCPVGKGNIGIKDELIETPWVFRVYESNVKVRWTDSSADFCAPLAIDVVQEHFSGCDMSSQREAMHAFDDSSLRKKHVKTNACRTASKPWTRPA